MMLDRDIKQLQQILMMRKIVAYLLALKYIQHITDRKHKYDSNNRLIQLRNEKGDGSIK